MKGDEEIDNESMTLCSDTYCTQHVALPSILLFVT